MLLFLATVVLLASEAVVRQDNCANPKAVVRQDDYANQAACYYEKGWVWSPPPAAFSQGTPAPHFHQMSIRCSSNLLINLCSSLKTRWKLFLLKKKKKSLLWASFLPHQYTEPAVLHGQTNGRASIRQEAKGGEPDPSAAAELFPTFPHLIYFRPTINSVSYRLCTCLCRFFIGVFIFHYLQLAICRETRLFLELLWLEIHSGQ